MPLPTEERQERPVAPRACGLGGARGQHTGMHAEFPHGAFGSVDLCFKTDRLCF